MFKKFVFSIFLFFAVAFSGQSFAQEPSPVMIVRFNSDFVNYDRQLPKIVDSVKEIKSDAVFNLVHVTKKDAKTPDKNINRIIEKLVSEGVEKKNIKTTNQPSLLAKYEEIHIFVR